MTREEAIKEYQCPGCVSGPDLSCVTKCDTGIGCGAHCPGTMMFPIAGTIFLGMPKGFDRRGPSDKMALYLFQSFEDYEKESSHPTVIGTKSGYDEFNIPVWKFLDKNGNTVVRGLRPRINVPFLHVILGDCRDKINCLEVTQEMQSMMD